MPDIKIRRKVIIMQKRIGSEKLFYIVEMPMAHIEFCIVCLKSSIVKKQTTILHAQIWQQNGCLTKM